MMNTQPRASRQRAESGFSLLELMVVVGIIGVLSAMTLPQLAAMRRIQRAAAVPFLVKTQIRMARQQAMSQRQPVTFQYDDRFKQVAIVTGGVQSRTLSLIGDGITSTELMYGPPPAMSGALGDSTNVTVLSGNQINITFQPDGSVIDGAGQPVNFALFFYNSKDPKNTASAISVLGSAGRVKTWRYNSSANKFVE